MSDIVFTIFKEIKCPFIFSGGWGYYLIDTLSNMFSHEEICEMNTLLFPVLSLHWICQMFPNDWAYAMLLGEENH